MSIFRARANAKSECKRRQKARLKIKHSSSDQFRACSKKATLEVEGASRFQSRNSIQSQISELDLKQCGKVEFEDDFFDNLDNLEEVF